MGTDTDTDTGTGTDTDKYTHLSLRHLAVEQGLLEELAEAVKSPDQVRLSDVEVKVRVVRRRVRVAPPAVLREERAVLVLNGVLVRPVVVVKSVQVMLVEVVTKRAVMVH